MFSVVEYRKAEYRDHKRKVNFCYFGLDTVEKNITYSTKGVLLKHIVWRLVKKSSPSFDEDDYGVD